MNLSQPIAYVKLRHYHGHRNAGVIELARVCWFVSLLMFSEVGRAKMPELSKSEAQLMGNVEEHYYSSNAQSNDSVITIIHFVGRKALQWLLGKLLAKTTPWSLPKKCLLLWMFNHTVIIPYTCIYILRLMCTVNWQNAQYTLLLLVDFLYTERSHCPPYGMPGRTQRHCVAVMDMWSGFPGTDQGLFHAVSCQ